MKRAVAILALSVTAAAAAPWPARAVVGGEPVDTYPSEGSLWIEAQSLPLGIPYPPGYALWQPPSDLYPRPPVRIDLDCAVFGSGLEGGGALWASGLGADRRHYYVRILERGLPNTVNDGVAVTTAPTPGAPCLAGGVLRNARGDFMFLPT